MGVKASEMGGAIRGIAAAGRRHKSMRVNISLQPTIRFNIESRDLRGSDGSMNASAVVAETCFLRKHTGQKKSKWAERLRGKTWRHEDNLWDASHFRKCRTSNGKEAQPTEIE